MAQSTLSRQSTFWRTDDVVDHLSYPQFRAILDVMAKRRIGLTKMIRNAMDSFTQANDNSSRMEIANKALSDIKQVAPTAYSTELDNLRSLEVNVTGPDGVETIYEVMETSPAEVLKDMLRGQIGEDASNPVLSFRGTEMKDNETFRQHLVANGSRLSFQPNGNGHQFDLLVNGLSRTRNIRNCSPSMPVDDLRRQVAEMEDLKTEEVAMSAMGKPLQNGFPLSHYNISGSTSISSFPRMLGGLSTVVPWSAADR